MTAGASSRLLSPGHGHGSHERVDLVIPSGTPTSLLRRDALRVDSHADVPAELVQGRAGVRDGGAGAVDLGDATPAHWLTCAKCQARIPERVASCTLCATLWSQCVIPPDEAHPVYCSERCKRKHMPEHRSWQS